MRAVERPGGGDPRELVLDTIRDHAGSLLATARRYSICADDAHDAYQRALEIFIRRAHRLDRDGAPGWLRTVVKHEALAVRAGRQRLLGGVDADLDAHTARDARSPEDLAAEADRVTRSAEALQRLKPQEVRALLLRAQGHSYREICDLTGWSYTKVNRCLTEGRRSFLDRYAVIESGRECERWAPVLSAIADGEATSEDLLAARPHLRNCAACRAAIRDFRAAPGALAAVVPAAALALGDRGALGGAGALARAYESVAGALSDRVTLSAHKLQAGLEAASTGKLAAVAASATALGGGVAAVGPPLGDLGAVPARSRPAAHRNISALARSPQVAAAPSAGGEVVAARPPDPPGPNDRATSPPRPSAPPAEQEFGFEPDGAPRDAPTSATASAASDSEFGAPGAGAASGAGGTSTASGASREFGP